MVLGPTLAVLMQGRIVVAAIAIVEVVMGVLTRLKSHLMV